MKKKLKPFRKQIDKYLSPDILIAVGLILISIFAMHRISYNRTLALDEQTLSQYQVQTNQENRSKPSHIYIPWFVDVELRPHLIADGEWTIDPDVGSYLTQSAVPGEAGNIIIYGHNTREILGNIRALKGNEKITLTTENGQEHTYQITQLQEVSPEDTELLEPTNEEVLTIYTCSGFWDKQRFVVRAVPLETTADGSAKNG